MYRGRTSAAVGNTDDVRDGAQPVGIDTDDPVARHGPCAARGVEERAGSTITVARRWQVGKDTMLEMKHELRSRAQVRQPFTLLGRGYPTQVDVVVEVVKDDLDAPRLAGTPPHGGDIDRAVLGCR